MNNISFLEATDPLISGKVGIFPTDTAYGIGCRVDDSEAVERIYKIRNRPSEKALLILVSSLEMAYEYGEFSDNAKLLADKYWPGGLTMVVACNTQKIPSNVRAGGDTIAIRLPNHKALIELIDKIDVPIVAPSANFSGSKTPFEYDELDPELISHADFVVKGDCTIKGVSTIIDTTVDPFVIIREGVVIVS